MVVLILNQKRTTDHGYKKGHAPRALHDGALNDGHLKATSIVGATNSDLLSYCVCRSKSTAPEPHIARASELVRHIQLVMVGVKFKELYLPYFMGKIWG